MWWEEIVIAGSLHKKKKGIHFACKSIIKRCLNLICNNRFEKEINDERTQKTKSVILHIVVVE